MGEDVGCGGDGEGGAHVFEHLGLGFAYFRVRDLFFGFLLSGGMGDLPEGAVHVEDDALEFWRIALSALERRESPGRFLGPRHGVTRRGVKVSRG